MDWQRLLLIGWIAVPIYLVLGMTHWGGVSIPRTKKGDFLPAFLMVAEIVLSVGILVACGQRLLARQASGWDIAGIVLSILAIGICAVFLMLELSDTEPQEVREHYGAD